MLTAIVHVAGQPMALAETLTALVPAVAEGLMSHAVVVSSAQDEDVERIADAMGATLIVAPARPWAAGAAAARGNWVLLLEAGETPDHGWTGAVEGHLMRQQGAAGQPALLPLAGGFASWGEWLFEPFAAGGRSGLVAPRDVVAGDGRLERARRLRVGRRRSGA